ncbi:hypothetical protein [Anaerocolumna xylanovorans]|uniref:Uncharacterized protein n=1 Tax=Anaerocolumna xylanovorans DSM 12503 TaxID=1121345 RepID=A0A1M7YCQ7_9FIRM|nr:hypothetical protein [Anaerocolumna xylanovorans]SHO50381.1 hypothetical protein SAMN02745217_02735 [Anaerocolumna xylanovorans DSM 12503]
MPSMKDEKDIINNNGDTRSDSFSSEDIYSRLNEASDMEDADEDLLALLDMISAQDEKQKNNSIPETVNKVAEKEPVKEKEPDPIFSMDDFNVTGEEPSHEEETADSFAADEVLEADSKDTSPKSKNLDSMGDVFSDALSAMDRLEDEELPENFAGSPKEKSGLFSGLFSKKEKKDKKEEEKEPKVKTKAEKKEKKAKDDKSKAAKPAAQDKNKNKKPAEPQLTEEEKAKIEKKKEEKAKKAAAKAEKKKVADAKKAEKKKAAADKAAIKQQKKQEKKELTPPDPDDNVKLNTLGVVFIMTFFILIAGVVIIGTKAYSYNLSVKSASLEYSRGRYTEAYYEIYGLNVRKQDYKTYDRIMTTMYVNKELNSYYNYMEMKKYPEALDSLLKGLDRYEIHIDHAKELGIEKNLSSVKKQILKELKKSYGLTEKQAKTINTIDDQAKYSVKVINTASEKYNND